MKKRQSRQKNLQALMKPEKLAWRLTEQPVWQRVRPTSQELLASPGWRVPSRLALEQQALRV